MKKVGIVSCDEWKEKIQEDLLLRNQLICDGLSAEIISWQDLDVNYDDYLCLIIRSVWGYHRQYDDFKKWLYFLKDKKMQIYNPVDLILDNIRKDVQFAILDNYDIPHISTQICKKNVDVSEIKELSIIKPIISGSGNNTYIVSNGGLKNSISRDDISLKYREMFLNGDNGLMIQPFIQDVENGEYSCVFIDGFNTHNMCRYPGIFTDKKKPCYLELIPNNVVELAKRVERISEFKEYLYMRVDIVVTDGKPLVMEVELTEPDLLIKYIQDELVKENAVKTFAKRLERRL